MPTATSRSGTGNVSAYILISMAALRRGADAATSGGAMVAIERALGWSRQLRLTPLHAGRLHRRSKACVALLLGLGSVLAVNVVGAWPTARPTCRVHVWIGAALVAWLVLGGLRRLRACSSGTSLPGENVMQVLGPGCWPLLAVDRRPLSSRSPPTPTACATSPSWTPMYGLAEMARVAAPRRCSPSFAWCVNAGRSGWPCSSPARPGA